MDILDEEILELWRALNKNNVSYIMVGGLATNLNGFSRFTAYIDLWIKNTTQNRKCLRKAISEIGLGDLESIETTQFIPGWTNLTLSSGMELDIMTELAGFKDSDFELCYNAAPVAIIYNIPVRFLHINHLIANKKSAGRSKDLIDIIELEKIQKELGSK